MSILKFSFSKSFNRGSTSTTIKQHQPDFGLIELSILLSFRVFSTCLRAPFLTNYQSIVCYATSLSLDIMETINTGWIQFEYYNCPGSTFIGKEQLLCHKQIQKRGRAFCRIFNGKGS